jgi:APA family basic amino acid/polyamine antiporter
MTLSESRESRGQLLHILGVSFGIAVAVGGMIGAGILRTPSLIAAAVPDAGVIVALWAIGAVHTALEANVLSELATAVPRAGGFYVYAHRAFGDVGGLVVGWTTWITRLCSTAALSVAFADFLGILWPFAAQHTVLTAVAMQLTVFGFNTIGLREGRALQQATSIAKALALAAFCVVAFVTAAPPQTTVVAAPAAFGWVGIVAAYQFIVGAYSGWGEPTFFAEENTQPGRSLPRAMFIGIVLAGTLYVAINIALLHALGVGAVAHGTLPYTTVLTRAFGASAGTLFAIGAMVVVASCANAGIMSAPRVLLALSRDSLLPAVFSNVNKGGSPYAALAMTAAGALILTLSGSFGLLFGLIGTLSVGSLLLAIAAIFVLRRREPELARPWRAFGYPFLPALVLIVDIALLVLFLNANWWGALTAAILFLACIPFAMVARRANRKARS